MQQLKPIHIVKQIAPLSKKLVDFLTTLSPADWNAQTIAPKWKVRDVVAHLIDGNLRTLSMLRDNYYGTNPKKANDQEKVEPLLAFLNRLNTEWTVAMQRLSPSVLINLLAATDLEYRTYLEHLDPFEQAVFSVAWAGEEHSKNWFHTAREYTEKWHHQQQIRLAVGEKHTHVLYVDEFYYPHLETSMRALPYHYRNTEGNAGDVVKIVVYGKHTSEKIWYLVWKNTAWQLYEDKITQTVFKPNCEVWLKDEVAWRVFTKGINRQTALEQSVLKGKRVLGVPIFYLTAVMA